MADSTLPNQKQQSAKDTAFFYPEFSFGPGEPVEAILHAMAGNTGNIYFWESMAPIIQFGTRLTQIGPIPADIKTLVLSMGNWISSSTDMGWYVDEIERSNVENVVVIGAGVQVQRREEEIVLSPGTRRFLDLISERSKSIGVRGDFTAEVLSKLGIKNVDVVGCPSIFLIDGNFRAIETESTLRIATHTTWHGHYRDAIAELLRFGIKYDALFVEQAETSIMRLLQTKALDSDSQFRIRYYSDNDADSWKLLDWLSRRAHYYLDSKSWNSAMRQVDLSIGSRFHGNIAAAAAGARVLLLTIDVRTEELARYFNMPHMRLTDFDERTDPKTLWDAADPSLFLKTLPMKKERMWAFLLKNGLKLSPSVTGLKAEKTLSPIEPEIHDRSADERRLVSDGQVIGLSDEAIKRELNRRSQPMRDAEEGSRIENSEFIFTYAERAGHEPVRARVSWRDRQGVAPTYVHQPEPTAYDDRGMKDEWQRGVYENAARIAEANNFTSVVDYGCGSGFKLINNFGGLQTTGVEIEPTLSELKQIYPERAWIDGSFLRPEIFNVDLVICSDVLEHLMEPDRLLSAFAASKGRIFILSTPALELLADRGKSNRGGPPTNPTHIYEWSTREFADLVGRHLKIISHSISNLPQATQLCIAYRHDDRSDYILPNVITDTKRLVTS
ncbi:hypothetical protein J2X76_003271 [Neorhizobium sp. 2083]|uniref:polysaccharide pyruvyl transferase family protein n=1 Tax=Neorhizobium sp. 2083 TaxID=2817762 RepID=UPI00285E0559|nr:polysaccharide pyruvyl transferase family protein [Neorhizobium sp. 2083]MDR6818094.1 hypothetical protein [Neorhizobium sp. 2083]